MLRSKSILTLIDFLDFAPIFTIDLYKRFIRHTARLPFKVPTKLSNPPPLKTTIFRRGGVRFSKNNSRKLFYDHNSFFTSNYTNEDMSESKNYRYSTKRKFFKSIWKKSCDHFFNFFGRNPPLPPKIHINAFLQGFQTVL